MPEQPPADRLPLSAQPWRTPTWRFLRRKLPRWLRDRSGVAAIEFAIVGPLFFMVLLGVLIFAIYFGTVHSVQQIAAEAARATVQGLTETERNELAQNHVKSIVAQYPLIGPELRHRSGRDLAERRQSLQCFHQLRRLALHRVCIRRLDPHASENDRAQCRGPAGRLLTMPRRLSFRSIAARRARQHRHHRCGVCDLRRRRARNRRRCRFRLCRTTQGARCGRSRRDRGCARSRTRRCRRPPRP